MKSIIEQHIKSQNKDFVLKKTNNQILPKLKINMKIRFTKIQPDTCLPPGVAKVPCEGYFT